MWEVCKLYFKFKYFCLNRQNEILLFIKDNIDL